MKLAYLMEKVKCNSQMHLLMKDSIFMVICKGRESSSEAMDTGTKADGTKDTVMVREYRQILKVVKLRRCGRKIY